MKKTKPQRKIIGDKLLRIVDDFFLVLEIFGKSDKVWIFCFGSSYSRLQKVPLPTSPLPYTKDVLPPSLIFGISFEQYV